MFPDPFLVSHFRGLVKPLACQTVRQVLLLDVMVGIIVGVFVSGPMAQILRSPVMGVLQMGRHRHRPLVPDCPHGCKYGIAGSVALGRARHIGDCLGQDDLGLGHPDPLHRLGRADGYAQRLGICVAHILGGADHDAPGDELDILPGIQHPGQVVDRRVRIGPPHAFDKGGNGVVMVVPVLIVTDRPLLDTLLGHIQGDVDHPIR